MFYNLCLLMRFVFLKRIFMRILLIHQNFPGQYKHLAPALAARGHQVVALGMHEMVAMPGVTTLRYGLARAPMANLDTSLGEFEAKRLRGESAAQACAQLRTQGFVPDVIGVHPGWGEALFLHLVYPEVPQIHYCEFFYNTQNSDTDFDPEFLDTSFANLSRITLKNSNNLLSLQYMRVGMSPTHWQRQQFPTRYRDAITVIHDGIDTQRVAPNPTANLTLNPSMPPLQVGDEVITFVNRNLEPCRGFHTFMRALPALLADRPKAQVVIVGGESVSYGRLPTDFPNWKAALLAEVGEQLDLSRVHFVGNIPYAAFLSLLQISAAHVYLTYPFVLSWSLLEAMSAGCLIVASNTPPVAEVIRHHETGYLVDFFDPNALCTQIIEALENPAFGQQLRQQARALAQARYDLMSVCLPQQLALFEQTVFGT